jgi:putative protein-disulfide isomerase
MTGKHLLYFADPMCSWCYGFAPVIAGLSEHFGARLPVEIVMGGLRAGNTRPMADSDKRTIRRHWEHVHQASGQPFDFSFFDRDGFVYDTEPACRAVVAMRLLNRNVALAFMKRIQQAFYAENRDVTSAEVLSDLAGDAGIDRDGFLAEMQSTEARNATFRDFLTAQEAGVQGFPTLLAGSSDQDYALVTRGYRPIDGLVEALEGWLAAPAAHPEVDS